MQKKLIIYILSLTILKIIITIPSCKEGENNCSMCNPITKLCAKCEKEVYVIDENGGCTYSKKCRFGENFCIECNEEENFCKYCQEDYYPDQNGGCSNTDKCQISETGICLECIKDYILIGVEENLNNEIRICKWLNSDDLKNCNNISIVNGTCNSCKEGFYLNEGDKKCIDIENCYKSSYGKCLNCTEGFYLDKNENKCKNKTDNFINCKESLNGKICSKCDDNFFLEKDGKCIPVNYCSKSNKDGKCIKCIDNYYLTNFENACTSEKNCFSGDKEFGICDTCQGEYYLDLKDRKCKSNIEDNNYKYCSEVDENGICKKCVYDYFLGKDNKCCYSQFCLESENQICKKCINNYHLGLDNLCIDIENCIYSDYLRAQCIECEDKYYYDIYNSECKIAEGNFTNCKSSNNMIYCENCKDDFYLNQSDHICYSNKEKNNFYKCAISDIFGEKCMTCIDNYYLGAIDNKCSTIEGCEISENENKCKQCYDNYYCLNIKTGKCEINDEIISEEKKFYYRCNKTNEDGNACKSCLFDFTLNDNGLCVDGKHCEEKKDSICQKCKNDGLHNYCLNKDFGCIELYDGEGCLECNNIFDLGECTKCMEGYELNYNGKCIEIEN